MARKPKMVSPATWEQFRRSGLLWWVNRTLHLFGWAIVVEVDEDDPNGKIKKCYPARCRFRGFDEKSEDQGFKRLTRHMRDSARRLKADVEA